MSDVEFLTLVIWQGVGVLALWCQAESTTKQQGMNKVVALVGWLVIGCGMVVRWLT